MLNSRLVNTLLINTAKRPGNIKKKISHHKLHNSKRKWNKRISSPCLHWKRTPLELKINQNNHSKKIWTNYNNNLQEIALTEEEPYHKTTIWWTCKIHALDNKQSTETQVHHNPQEEVHKQVHNRLVLNYHSIQTKATFPIFRLNNSQSSLKRKNTWRVSPSKWNTTISGHQTLNNTSIHLVSSRSSASSTTKKRANL